MGGDARRRRRHRAALANPSSESLPPLLELVDRRVDKDVSEVSSSEQPNDSVSTLYYSTDRLNKPTYDAGSKQGSSKIAEDKTRDDSDDVEECLRKLKEYYSKGHIHSSIDDACNEVLAYEHAALTALALEWGMEPPEDPFRQQNSSVDDQEDEPHQQALSQQNLQIHRPRYEVSLEEIADDGKKWMGEEVMVAFKNYIEGKPDLSGHEYRLELQHQCFNVENYYENFHHYNFSVKMKKYDSDDWNETIYFAEVKMIFRRKYYFCCPLEPLENGHCYACRNQGMDELRHPATGGFEMGSPDTAFPYMYTSD
ncbi:hypothetical protein OsI_28403 [Oryza sativa Indica Group]|uniref:DUF3615 domain-containing protein n=1 Tax=Oryza sativa subsp. indica TaxID=39946 RepID=A2YSV7_ORYSI|nr:hypothetical protein OsI_28403 [Oryza sativa Indica Group]